MNDLALRSHEGEFDFVVQLFLTWGSRSTPSGHENKGKDITSTASGALNFLPL